MDSLRQKQIREVLDNDNRINQIVFDREKKFVQSVKETYAEPKKTERIASYNVQNKLNTFISSLDELITEVGTVGIWSDKVVRRSLILENNIFKSWNDLVLYINAFLQKGQTSQRDIDDLVSSIQQESLKSLDQIIQLLEANDLDISSLKVLKDYIQGGSFQTIRGSTLPIFETGTTYASSRSSRSSRSSPFTYETDFEEEPEEEPIAHVVARGTRPLVYPNAGRRIISRITRREPEEEVKAEAKAEEEEGEGKHYKMKQHHKKVMKRELLRKHKITPFIPHF